MKKIVILIILISLSILLLAKAEITFDNLVHDYGEIAEDDGPYKHEYHFTNTGDEPFKLVKVKAG